MNYQAYWLTETTPRKPSQKRRLRLRLFLPVQYPHYSVELQDGSGQTLWINNTAKPGQDKTLQIFIPRDFLSAGTAYQLRVFGLDGDTRPEVGAYDVAVPAE